MVISCRKIENGQGLIEYALILVGVAVVTILVLNLMGINIGEVYCQAVGAVGGEACDAVDVENVCTMTFDDDSALDDWTGWDVGRNLTVEDGKLCNTGNQMNYFDLCGENIGSSDFTANLNGIDVERLGKNLNPGFDFLFRTDESTNGYWFSYSAQANLLLFWKGVSGTRVRLGSARVPPEWAQGGLDLQLKVEGDTFTAYKDGAEILQVSDDAYTDGKFGWRNKPGSHTCIDEISIATAP